MRRVLTSPALWLCLIMLWALTCVVNADTVPGVAGVPSSQVITVQGCSGCISTGGGGGSNSFPYSAAYNQGVTASSFLGMGGWDYATSSFDSLTVAPFTGNSSGTGFPAAYGQPGILVVQGGYQGGGFLTFGDTQITGLPFTAATAQPLPGPTSTATPVPNAGFLGIGGSDYSSGAASLFNPLKVSNLGSAHVTCDSGCSGGGGGAAVAYGPYTVPTSAPTPQPIVTGNGSNLIGGADYAGNFNAIKVNSAGSQIVAFPTTAPVQIQNGANTVAVNSSGGLNSGICDNTTFTTCATVAGSGGVDAVYTRIMGGGNTSTASTLGFTSDSVSAGNGLEVGSHQLLFNNSSSWERTYGADRNSDGYTHSLGIQANAQNSTGGTTPIACDNSFNVNNITSAGTTTVQALTAAKNIWVCGFAITVGASTTFALDYSTSSTCASGVTAITGAFAGNITYGGGIGTVLKALPAGDSLCITVTGTGGVNGVITYMGPF